MLIDGHLVRRLDHGLHRRPPGWARPPRPGDLAVHGRPDPGADGARRERSAGRVLHDVGVRPVAAGLPGSCGRAHGRRARPRGRAGASVHVRVRPLPLRPAPPLASRAGRRARPGGRAAGDRRRARLPDLDRDGTVPPGSRAGRTRSLRGRPGQHPRRDGAVPGAPVAAGLLADAALRRRAAPATARAGTPRRPRARSTRPSR